MSLDSVLAFLGLGLALFSVTPRAKWLDYWLRLNCIGFFIIGVSAVLVHYLQFYPTFQTFGITPGFGLHRWGITPKNLTYLIFFASSIAIWLQISISPLRPSRIKRFRQLLDELISKESYGELFDLLEKHLDSFFKILRNDYFLPNLKERLTNQISHSEILCLMHEKGPPETYWDKKSNCYRIKGKWKYCTELISRIIPFNTKPSEVAARAISQILLNKKLIAEMVRLKPYLGVKILEHNFYDKEEFLSLYFEQLIKNTTSVLYYELKECTVLEKGYKWDISPSQRLLFFLFNDASVSKELEVYRPVGEYLIHYLDQAKKSPALDLDRDEVSPMYKEKTRFESTVYACLFFFDVMISRSLHSNIKWHMWLYYMPYFVERILNNMTIEDADKYTRYKYLLETILEMHRGWIGSIKEIPTTQENVKFTDGLLNGQDENIPVSAMKSLARCFEPIVHSDVVPKKWKEDEAHCIFSLFFKLRTDELKPYSKLLISNFKDKGYGGQIDEYKEFLREALQSFDKVPYYGERQECLNDLEAMINE